MQEDIRKQVFKRHAALQDERSLFLTQWRDVSKHVMPTTGHFLSFERHRNKQRFNKIYDSTATNAVRTLAAGMMSGMTSPARPWFKLATTDADLNRYQKVKEWLNDASALLHTIFHRSNTYRALHTIYEELALYGTAACITTFDYQSAIHNTALTAGEFCIATNWRGDVDTLYREFDKTVGETVREFGKDAVSQSVRSQYENGAYDQPVTIIHAIEPRALRNVDSPLARDMPWRSVYFEKGASEGMVLREGGFKRFPALCPRWSVSGGDIYGASPAMEAMGDIRQLQHQQLAKAKAIDYQVNPPLQVPTMFKAQEYNMMPGGIVYADASAPIQPIWNVGLDLRYLLDDIQDVRARIQKSFYADLFLMITQQDGRMTATEVAERHEEKMLMIGPVLERLQNELLTPLIDIAFDAALVGGILPPPPEELSGMELDVELVSILAQAQKAVQTNSIDRFTAAVGGMAQLNPQVLDKINTDKLVNIYGEALGIDPSIIVPDSDAEAVRQQRAEQQAQQEQMAQAAQMADATQKLGNTPVGQGSALDGVLEGLSGYN
ncbi:MAG: portal protein [Cardiobacteriaceae bacterium]|nr:portal protein [Cardiobacteriaceae bacterium]